MSSRLLALCCVALLGTNAARSNPERVESLLGKENLVAWCIVPFDAAKRGPAERAMMLREIGLRRCAYDWRAQHVPEFEDEILQYKKHGIEFTAFWDAHDQAFSLFEKHKLAPAIWKTAPSPKADTQEDKVKAAAESLLPLCRKAKKLGSTLGLYNHGGWGGKPANLVAVCGYLREEHDAPHVGIVYNFHHGHEDIATFESDFNKMLPFLHCLNLNGMTKLKSLDSKTKILPIGSGRHEQAMIQIVVDSTYEGPVGILDHISSADAKLSLEANLAGLDVIKKKLSK